MDGQKFNTLDGTTFVNGFANNVHDASKSSNTDGDKDGVTSVDDLCTTDETLCTVHGNSTNGVLSQMRSDLEDKTTTTEVLNLQGVKNWRKVVGVELNVDDGTNDGFYRANRAFCFSCIGAC